LTQGQLSKKNGVDELPDKDRGILKAILQAFIKKHRFEEFAIK
jgi:hypothetical protein